MRFSGIAAQMERTIAGVRHRSVWHGLYCSGESGNVHRSNYLQRCGQNYENRQMLSETSTTEGFSKEDNGIYRNSENNLAIVLWEDSMKTSLF